MPASTSSSRASAWEWIQAALLAANLAWTTLCLGGVLGSTLAGSSALTGALLFAHFAARALDRTGEGTRGFHPAGWWLLPFLVYAAINVLWVTPVRWLGWRDWYDWAQAIATFWVVLNGVRSRGPRTLLAATLGSLAFVGVVLACYQRFVQHDWIMLGRTQSPYFFERSSGSFGVPNSFGAFLILLLPACGALCLRAAAGAAQRVFFGWLAAVLAFGLMLTISRGAWIALALAFVAWPLLASRWTWRRRLASGAGVLAFVLLVGFAIYQVSPKARGRLRQLVEHAGELSRPILWRAAWKIFVAHPVAGGGAGSFNARFEEYRPEHEQTEPVWAHNDYLNTLSDYGALGGILLFGAAGAIAWRAGTARTSPSAAPERNITRHALDDPLVTQGFAIGLLAFALQLFVEFHFKIPALGLAFATIAALVVERAWRHDQAVARRGDVRFVCGAVALIAGGGLCLGFMGRFRAEGLREAARRDINRLGVEAPAAEKRSVVTRALAGFVAATEIDPANAQAWADRAYALEIAGNLDPSRERDLGREAEPYARRALDGGTIEPEFWLRLGVALDMQGRWIEAGDAFIEALRLAPARAQTWYYEAYHLALNPTTHKQAQAAVATCLRLDPSVREGETLRRNLAAGH